MNLFTLSLANIRAQPLATLLTLLLLILGVGTMVVLLLLNAQFKDRMQRDVEGIDLVVGAKGSPLQLILSSVYHIDIPTGNIPITDADAIAQHPMVAAVIPLALGDAVHSARIVGTTHDYVAHFGAELADGKLWDKPLDAVLGAEAALRTGFKVGDSFEGQHGIGGQGAAHGESPYQVTGILKPTGSAIDRLVLTSIESVHRVHETHAKPKLPPLPGAMQSNPSEEVTALLVKYRSPIVAITLPRLINAQTALQAAAPAFEIARLLRLVGIGIEVLRVFAYLLIAVAAISIFVALYSALQKRQFDIAVMRTLGASRFKVLRFIILEGLLLSVGGTLIGIAFGHIAAAGVAYWLRTSQQIFFSGNIWVLEELWLLLLAVVVGIIAALLPALRAYRLQIAQVLTER